MRNMKVSMKLILSFIIVIILAVIVGAVGIVGMYSINEADDAMYEGNYVPTVTAGNIVSSVAEQRVYIRNFVIYDAVVDAELFKSAEKNIEDSRAHLKELMDEYEPTIVKAEDRAAFDELVKIYNNEWSPMVDSIHTLGLENRTEEAKVALTSATDAAGRLNTTAQKLKDINMTDGRVAVDANTTLFNTMTIIEVVVLVAAIAIAMFLAMYISGLIGKPTRLLSDLMNGLVKTGDFHIDPSDMAKVEGFAKFKDETGVTAHAFEDLMEMILTKCDTLEAVAGGDLTMNVALRSDKDTLGNALHQMVENLNKMFGDINSSSNQVSTGSVQIADGAQLLAQGATEQSATVEELSASVAEIATQTKANAGTANETSNLAETIKVSAEQGSRQMEQMMQAVAEINESSKSIGKVIKIIDDIAFQTNILALNAAVEAARAGQHGKGFAVVADEVRSLAAKSAEAAKNTNELIESSIQKAEQGASISAETSESLQQIVDGILKTSELVATIAKSSNEQSVAISQIGEAIDQVSQVVQQNSATAEESAAASEEMSGQATLLQQLIAQFKLKNASGGGGYSASAAPARVASISSSPETGFSVEGGGKY